MSVQKEALSGSRLKHLPPTLLKQLDELLNDCEGPARLADLLEGVIHQAVVMGGAYTGLTSEECDSLYFPWRLMKALREAAAQAATVEPEMN